MAAMQMNQQQFQTMMQAGKTFLVDFWAPWCSYCRRISAAYDQLAEQNEGKLTVAKINIDDVPQLAAAEKIEVIPTLVLYRDGKAVASVVAPDSKAAIDRFLQNALEGE